MAFPSAVALVLGAGCAGTSPEPTQTPAAAPAQRVVTPDDENLVSYRPLRREDFRASEPPPRARKSAHVAAVTCTFLVPGPDLKFRALRKAGEKDFTAEVVGLSFSARMDPSCSWWDRESRFRPDDYVLEHEQIHFALVELVARDLNQRAEAIAARIRSTGETGEAALREIQRKFDAEFESAVERTLERSRRFDSETSLGFKPEAQAEWKQQIDAELEASGGPVATPDPPSLESSDP